LRANIGNVGYPRLIRAENVKLSIQPVRGNDRRYTPDMRTPAITRLGTQSRLPHQAVNTLLATRLSHIPQISMHRARAVDGTALQPELLELARQVLVLDAACRLGLVLLGVIAAGVHLQYAAAIFKILRSSVTRFNSASSCLNLRDRKVPLRDLPNRFNLEFFGELLVTHDT
jgi:hypothetical protein